MPLRPPPAGLSGASISIAAPALSLYAVADGIGGGPAGFGEASGNDVPMAEKAVVVSAAFLGVNMTCARCHDAPAHRSTQKELFQLAGLLANTSLTVPKTSSVPLDKLHTGDRPPLIKVTLQPGTTVPAAWPFAELLKTTADAKADARDRLAAWLTDPRNERFAQVAVNRVWARLMGRGLVEPVDDWERGAPSHPELLRWLGREFVRGGYDLRHVERLILTSHAYQRAADICEHLPSTRQSFQALFGLRMAAAFRGDLSTAAALGESALAMAEEMRDDDLVLEALLMVGNLDFWRGDLDRALQSLERVRAAQPTASHGEFVQQRRLTALFPTLLSRALIEGDDAVRDDAETGLPADWCFHGRLLGSPAGPDCHVEGGIYRRRPSENALIKVRAQKIWSDAA